MTVALDYSFCSDFDLSQNRANMSSPDMRRFGFHMSGDIPIEHIAKV